MNNIDLKPLETLADTFIEQYKTALQEADKVASGALLNSIDYTVEINDRQVTLSIYAEEHWKYVEYGRNPGKFPPLDTIKSWIKVKGLPRSGQGLLIKGHGAYDVTYTVPKHKRKTKDGYTYVEEHTVRRRIKAVPDRRVLPTENQLAYLIGRKIAKKGIPATNIVGNLVDTSNIYSKFENIVAKMISERFQKMVQEEINSIKDIKI